MIRAVSRDAAAILDRFAFPVVGPCAASFFVDTLCQARTSRQRAWCLMLKVLPSPLRVRLLRRLEPRHEEWAGGVVAQADRWLAEARETDAWVRGVRETCSVRVVMAVPDPKAGGRAVVFLLRDGEPNPVAVLKVVPASAGGSTLLHEARALRFLRKRLPPAFRPTVPEVIGYRRGDAAEGLLTTGIPGRSAYVDLHRNLAPHQRVARHFREAAEWLATFHLATRAPSHAVTTGELDDAVRRACQAAAPGGGGSRPDWASRLRDSCRRDPLVVTASHGDFWARNLLLRRPSGSSGPAAGVVDWERFEQRALPSEDLFHFPLTYGLNYPWSRFRRADAATAFRRTFLEENHVSREVARYLRIYCARTGLQPALLEPLLHLFLQTRAARSAADSSASGVPWGEFARLLSASSASVLNGLANGEA